MRTLGLWMKTAVDLVVALVLLVLAAPIMAVIAIAVKMESPGPVLFRQERAGKNGRIFRILKFRSMVDGADRSGPVLSTDDPRITGIGGFLRRTSLDELPQLLNVLRLEMSLVGPRPLLPGTTRPHERRRFDMRPGMTALASVSDPHLRSWDERIALDIWYVDNWSLLLDLMVVLRTIPIMFRRRDPLHLPRDGYDGAVQ